MAEPFKDPAAIWRDMVAQWEKGFNEFANKAMGTEEFSRSMNQATKMTLQAQQSMGDLMAKYLTALNLPTRADIMAIAERVQAIEESLVRIAEAMDRRVGDGQQTIRNTRKPPRTKRPPSAEGRKS